MKRFLITFFIALALVVGTAGAAPAAHAADPCPVDSAGNQSILGSDGECHFFENGTEIGTPVDPTYEEATLTDPAAEKTSKNYDAPPTTPKDGLNGIMAYIVQLFAWLLGVGAIVLDNAVYYTVVKMGDYVNNLSAVGVTWQIMRDIGNIVIIFGFLAIGISIILNTERLGYGKKMLPMLLIAAVFLNFSLFLSEAVIDTGNLFATQFYTQINGGNPAGAKTFGPSSINREGISNRIMASLGLQTIYGEAQDPKKAQILFENYWTIGFMSIILFLIAAFVFFSLAFILIARFIILLFLIIVAPIGFAGLAVPKLENTAKLWWHKLFEQTITAPVLLLLLYIALRVITDVQFLTGFSDCTAGSTGAGGCKTQIDYTAFATGNYNDFAPVILSFLVAMGLLMAVVIFSKKLSAFGAAGATALAGKLSFGATAWGMRTSGGWLAKKGANIARKTWVGRVPLAGTGLVRGLDKIASGSFDLRGVAMGGGLKAIGIDAGTAQKGGYKADLKARTESRTKYAGELTGRELNDDEKAKLTIAQNKIKQLEKDKKSATTVQQIKDINEEIKTIEKEEIEKIESVTEKGAQRKYATVLELGFDSKGVFNKYFNFAANTDAAKIIRAGAKKAKPDKDWSTNMKKLLEEAAKESGDETGASPTTPPAPGPTASATPPPGPTATPGGGTPSSP